MSFHVPESRRLTVAQHQALGTDASYGNNGAFMVESPEPGWGLFLICSDGKEPDCPVDVPWEHVSVHAFRFGGNEKRRTPSWREMAYVKDLCWDGEDVVVQFHPRKSEYVNNHPHVLHLWRPTTQEIPTPPTIAVGLTDREVAQGAGQ